MDSHNTYLVAALLSIVTEYVRKTSEWRSDIRTECLCWVILYIGLRWRHRASKKPQTEIEEQLLSKGEQRDIRWTTWSTSVAIAIARVLSVYYDSTEAMPLVIVSTCLALFYRDSKSSGLPTPGHGGLTKSKSQLRHPTQLFALTVIAVASLLFSDFSNVASFLVLILSVVATSSSFLLLDTCQNDTQQLPLPKLMEGVVMRVSLMVLGVFLIFPPSSSLAWQMVLQALCTSAGLAGTVYLIMNGHTVAATTIGSYSTAAVGGFLVHTLQETFIMPLVSLMSLAFGVSNLIPTTLRRRVLPLAVVPLIPFLTGHSTLWRLESYGSPTVFEASQHPITFLAAQAEAKFNAMVRGQSQTLSSAVAEYQRRYGRKPPRHFDTWFQAAQAEGFVLVDEFDSMMANLEPLWGVAASDIRARIENVIEASNGEGMYRFEISKDSNPSFKNPGRWMPQIFGPWFDQNIQQTLPDMVLAMNTMDEPKVVVPSDMLAHVLDGSRDALEHPPPPGKNPSIAQHVDFMNIGKQNTWDAMSVSCPSNSPARDFTQEADTSPFLTDIGFLSNVTLSKDVCQFPELHNIHAGLRHPDSMTITHALVPVFSQAKATCFNDILYPSAFYAEKQRIGEYKPEDDPDWSEKENIVYWTGSNTGGRSTTENWRHLQRQRMALLTQDDDNEITLLSKTQQPGTQKPLWRSENATIASIHNSTRIRISAAIQCEEDACEEQNADLHIVPGQRDDITDGYKARYNLDIDGNGMSGRFYRLLMSKSAVMKQTLYQEWHDDWLIPWVHYIPISMELQDFPETVRYLTQEPEGQALGEKIAEDSFDWSRKVLRNADMRLFWWRLMLEYGRLLSDDRDELSYQSWLV